MTFVSGDRTNHEPSNAGGLVLDLTDESGLLVERYVEASRNEVRCLISALHLVPSTPRDSDMSARVFDLAMFKATGSIRLAELLCREFDSGR